ncbi:MAG: hypothetical protein PHC61_08230 [Chitinivibrionales bacterium]|nr:hypothetical protein [Chitinivibrionales bacterium]
MQRFLTIIATMVLFAVFTGNAQNSAAGTTVFSFASLSYDARSIAMAGANAAILSDIYGVVANPAALASITAPRAMISFRPVLLDVGGGPVAGAFPIGQRGVLALSLLGFTEGSIEETNADKEMTGVTYYAGGGIGSISWAQKIYESLFAGASLKGLYHRFNGSNGYVASSDGGALDAGVQYRLLKDRFIAGVMVKNLGFMTSAYTADGLTYALPLTATIGFSYVLRNVPSLRLTCDIEKKTDDYVNFRPAFELALYKKSLFLRGGYALSQSDLGNGLDFSQNEKSNWTTLCLGLGLITTIKSYWVELDVAYEGHVHDLPPSLAISGIVGF